MKPALCLPSATICWEAERPYVEAHLEELLASRSFRGSRRSCEFLRHIVSETLAGRGHILKERNIAVDVFKKAEDFDAQNGSIVRVNAADVRKRLAHAYEELQACRVTIELPVGSYQPLFHFVPAPASVVPELPVPVTNKGLRLIIFAVVAVLAAIAFGGFSLYRNQSPEDLLWKPFVSDKAPVLVSLPAPPVYQLAHDSSEQLLVREGLLPISELRNRESLFVGTGAAYGAARFGEQLARRGQTFVLKFGTDVTFTDLKQMPTILLGASTSFWTMEITRNLSYRIDHDSEGNAIVDTGGHRGWRVTTAGEPTEGYALVTRLIQSDTGHPLLMAAGMTQVDTQASVEFLTNPQIFQAFALQMPKDWPKRNLQIVLHSFFHGHSPGTPTVVAFRVW